MFTECGRFILQCYTHATWTCVHTQTYTHTHTHTHSQVDREKVNDGNVDQLSHEERLSRVRDFFTKSGKMAPPITKPKPKPKKPSVVVTGEDAIDGSITQELSPSSTEVGVKQYNEISSISTAISHCHQGMMFTLQGYSLGISAYHWKVTV